MPARCLLAALGDDPHTQGLFRVARIARRGGMVVEVLPPGASLEQVWSAVRSLDPDYLGLSYRLSPKVALSLFEAALSGLAARGLLRRGTQRPRRVALAGLPEAMAAVNEHPGRWPCPVHTMPQLLDPMETATRVLDFLEIGEPGRTPILDALYAETHPPRISLLDELAGEVTADDSYREEPPLPLPSAEAQRSWVARMAEADLPLLRTHFGIPAPDISPTVEGIARLAEARVVDEISLGSSDLSQRYFGHPQEFIHRKNDGGVPYQTVEDLKDLVQAARRGNSPAVKPYAHVVDLVPFVDTCLRSGMLVGGHQAVPLYWFNELDGRGPTSVRESLREHIAAVRALAAQGLPVEMNDPNQWSSRWAHDTVIAADYGLIAAVMLGAGARDLVLQLQMSKPRETGDYADLAKMTAGLSLAERLLETPEPGRRPTIHRETRAGIDAFDPDLDVARRQLARSTFLQLLLRPRIIHLVSYCEALHVAAVEDVIDSSRLVRRCVRVFRRHAHELLAQLEDPRVLERRRHLVGEAELLLRAIASLGPGGPVDPSAPLWHLAPRLADPEVLFAALERGLMGAPGILHPAYPAARRFVTGPTASGGIDCLDPDTGFPMPEAERLGRLIQPLEPSG